MKKTAPITLAIFLALFISDKSLAEQHVYDLRQDTTDRVSIKKGEVFALPNANDGALFVQNVDNQDITSIDGKRTQEYHIYRINGNAPLSTDNMGNYVSRGFYQGLYVDTVKKGDGSGHAFTANVGVGQTSRYNEGGAFQGRVSNIGSNNSYLSFSEGIIEGGAWGQGVDILFSIYSVIIKSYRYRGF